MLLKRFDDKVERSDVQEFVPIVGHVDKHTLLTKNGSLIQTFYIKGIRRDFIPQNIENTRSLIREALANELNSDRFAVWIHTTRDHVDVSTEKYKKNLGFADFVSEKWMEANFLNKSFSNCIYISIVYRASELEISNFGSFLNSFFSSIVTNYHNSYITEGLKVINNLSERIIDKLKDIDAIRLGIVEKDNNIMLSQNLSFFYYLLNFEKKDFIISEKSADEEMIFASEYKIARDFLEIKNKNTEYTEYNEGKSEEKKFVSILSLKEYIEISEDTLDKIISSPFRFIITEVFYFIPKSRVLKNLKYDNEILNISQSSEMIEAKGYNYIFDNEKKDINQNQKFIDYQMNFSIIADSENDLYDNVSTMSSKLSDFGIIHVKEDIKLENIFWSNLPSNFNYLSRMNQGSIWDGCGFASIQNFPIGRVNTKWENYITVLKNHIGSFYFFNFHNSNGVGHTCVYGGKKSGKTSCINFLLSQAIDNEKTVLYLSPTHKSELFIDAAGGKYYEEDYWFNPFLMDDTEKNRNTLHMMLIIICNNYEFILEEKEIEELKNFVNFIFSIEKSERLFSVIFQKYNFEGDVGNVLKNRLSILNKEEYLAIFDSKNEFSMQKNQIVGVNLYKISNVYYKEKNYPMDDNLMPEYNKNLKLNQNIMAAYGLFLIEYYKSLEKGRNILVMDEIFEMINNKYFEYYLEGLFKDLTESEGILISSITLENYVDYSSKLWEILFDYSPTRIILPLDKYDNTVAKRLRLNYKENRDFNSLSLRSRLCLLHYEDYTILVELNLNIFKKKIRIFSSSMEDIERYKSLKKDKESLWFNDF
jgi:type IV secretion system protein VirB4